MSFYTFYKIFNDNPLQVTPIMVQRNSIFYMNEDYTQSNYVATRVEIYGFPNYSFYTPTPLSLVLNSLAILHQVIDARSGAGVGTQCANTPGVIDFVYPVTYFPFIRANMIVNHTRSQLQEYIFNPNYLVFAEESPFRDIKTGLQDVGLTLVLRDSQAKNTLLTDLSFAELSTILDPHVIPVS